MGSEMCIRDRATVVGSTNASFNNGTTSAILVENITTNVATILDIGLGSQTLNGDLSETSGVVTTAVDGTYMVVWEVQVARTGGPAGNTVIVQPIAAGASQGTASFVIPLGEQRTYSGSYVESLSANDTMNFTISGGDQTEVSQVRISMVRIA